MKKKKVVQPVEAKTQENETSPQTVPEEQPQEAPVAAEPTPVLIEVPKLSQDHIDAAKTFNIPLDKVFEALHRVNTFAASVEARFTAIQTEMPALVQNSMAQAIQNAQRESVKQTEGQGQPSGGAGGLENILLKVLAGGGGGGGLDETSKLLMDLGRENLMLGREITREFIKRSMPEVLSKVDKSMDAYRSRGKGEKE